MVGQRPREAPCSKRKELVLLSSKHTWALLLPLVEIMMKCVGREVKVWEPRMFTVGEGRQGDVNSHFKYFSSGHIRRFHPVSCDYHKNFKRPEVSGMKTWVGRTDLYISIFRKQNWNPWDFLLMGSHLEQPPWALMSLSWTLCDSVSFLPHTHVQEKIFTCTPGHRYMSVHNGIKCKSMIHGRVDV